MIEFETKRSGNDYYHTIDIYNLNFREHTHRSYEIVFVKAGTLKVNIENTEYIIYPNSAVIISPYQIHSFETLQENNIFSCIFSPDLLQDYYDYTKHFDFKNPVFSFDIKDLSILTKQYKNVFEQKAVLYKYCSAVMNQGLKKKTEQKNFHLLSQISLYIQNNIKNDLSLKNMCTDLGYSYNYISGIFKKNFGMNFSAYANQIRLDEAAEMLKCTDKTSAQTANDCGFSTIRNFNISFKKQFGMSPKEYKKQYNHDKNNY